MRKFLFLLILFLASHFILAQQNEFFRETKDFYDQQEFRLKEEYKKYADKMQNWEIFLAEREMQKILHKIDSARNVAYIHALIKTKNAEILSPKKIELPKEKKSKRFNREAIYEDGGIEGFRAMVMQNFSTAYVKETEGVQTTLLTFLVEKDGSITNVKTEGESASFNKQAEIAVYLTPNKFSPAIIRGEKVRSVFRFPMKIRFE